jgi:hypothetical protein
VRQCEPLSHRILVRIWTREIQALKARPSPHRPIAVSLCRRFVLPPSPLKERNMKDPHRYQ